MPVGISRLHHPVSVLGYGTRAGVWLQGCRIHCPGCISQDTWDPAPPDRTVPVADVLAWIGSRGPVDGLTISGGEPFDQPAALEALIRGFRAIHDPHRTDVLVYSGYPATRLRRLHGPVFGLADAVVTGPYQADGNGEGLRGSGNQEIHANTGIGRTRYLDNPVRAGLQAVAAGGSLWLIGIPRQGDMERAEEALRHRGVELHDVSWRC